MSIQYWTTANTAGSGEAWIVEGNIQVTTDIHNHDYIVDRWSPILNSETTPACAQIIESQAVPFEQEFDYVPANFISTGVNANNRVLTMDTIRGAVDELNDRGYVDEYDFIRNPNLELDYPNLVNQASWGQMIQLHDAGVLNDDTMMKLFNYAEGEFQESEDEKVNQKVHDIFKKVMK